METVTIDSRGRVVIPKSARRRLGLVPKERLILLVEGGEVRLRPHIAEQPVIRPRRRWGKRAFLKAGEALFAGDE